MSTRRLNYSLVLTVGVSFVTLLPRLSHAQEPGTNVATPPPAPTPLVASPGSTPISLTPTPFAPPGQEPVIDASTTRTTYPNRPLLVTGVLVLGLSYAGSAVVAATSDREADDKLYYPVAGPWLDLNHRGCDVDKCDNNSRDRALLVADGIVQGAGALGVLLSLVLPEKTTRNWYLIGNREVTVVPRFGQSTLGLAAAGRF